MHALAAALASEDTQDADAVCPLYVLWRVQAGTRSEVALLTHSLYDSDIDVFRFVSNVNLQ